MSASQTLIHPTAIVGPDVSLASGVSVGPYCVIEGRVSIGENTQILAQTFIKGAARIGANCRIGPQAAVGGDPQHLGYKGIETWVTVGDHVQVREFVSVNRAFKPGEENATRIGSHCLLMSTSHVAHDCVLGEHVTLATAVMLGGHVTVGDRAFIGGGAGVHQFVRVGRLAMIGGLEQVNRDVLPFGMIRLRRHRAYNAVGVRRSGMSRESVLAIRAAFTQLHAAANHRQWAEDAQAASTSDAPAEVREMIDFVLSSARGTHASTARQGQED